MITLTRTQEGILRYIAGQSGTTGRDWGKPTIQTYKKLCALGLLEQSDTFPFHRATNDGHDWLVVKDGVVERMLQSMTADQIREALRDLTGMEPGRFGWNVNRAAAVLRVLERRGSSNTPVVVPGVVVTAKRIRHNGEEFDCFEYRVGAKHGLRLWERRNLATKRIDYRVVQGDGRTARFQLFEFHHDAAAVMVQSAVRRMVEGQFDGATPLDRTLDRF